MEVFAVCNRCERDIAYGEESSVVVVNREISSVEDGETVVRVRDSEIVATLCRECGTSLDVSHLRNAAKGE